MITQHVTRLLFVGWAAALFATSLIVQQAGAAEPMSWIVVGSDGKSFVEQDTGTRFTPWGFNYDHDGVQGRLLEEYWEDEWDTVVSDFREMKQLGANVVRIHLQVDAFMDAADRPKQKSLTRLARLVDLAEETGLYLNVTGLGCYHKQNVPAWYDALEEADRWQAQAVFWEAVAQVCAASPAVFCYDLLNEPVVPAGKKPQPNWLGPGFGGKHFVQYISRDRRDRVRHEVAQAWIDRLVTAIRKHDRRHMITVGLVPWSLDRPGITSGFRPSKIADRLDFIAVHLYPEKDKPAAVLETLKAFAAVGKPVLIEETFPLKCSAEQFAEFLKQSRPHAAGWIGFYWGTTPEEYRQQKSLQAALMLKWLELFVAKNPRSQE